MKSHWRWIASPELDPYPQKVVWRIGHQRWAIENHVFNELTQHYHLEHCPHHHPVAIIAWLLILVLGFNSLRGLRPAPRQALAARKGRLEGAGVPLGPQP